MEIDFPESVKSGPKRRGIYLLPNLFTTASLFSGFYSIISSTNQDFISAAIAIFIALVCDGLDGRVARLINAQSAFGAQYDSLSDLLSFGVAPAILAYNFNILYLGPLGYSKLTWISAFIFVAAVALRLARFNVQIDAPSKKASAKRYFYGLPCPPGAALIAGMLWFFTLYGYQSAEYSIIIVVILFFTAFLMVSNIHFRSFKDIDLRASIRFTYLVLAILILVGICWQPPQVLFGMFALYALSGPIFALINLKQRKRQKK